MEPASVNLATAGAATRGEAPAIPPAEARQSYHLGMFGSTPPFTRRERRVFWIATTTGFFNQYDFALLQLALPQIQKGLGIAERNLGAALSFIRFGYLLSLLITPFVDVFGRPRVGLNIDFNSRYSQPSG